MRAICIFILLFSSIATAAKYNPKNYFAFKDSDKELLFFEPFNDNKWTLAAIPDAKGFSDTSCFVSATQNTHIDSGILYYTNLCSLNSGYKIKLPIDINRNYEIVLNAKVIADSAYKWASIGWSCNNSYYVGAHYSFAQNGYNTIHFHNRRDGNCKNRVMDMWVNAQRKTLNRYTIRYYNGRCYVFVNGVLEKHIKAESLDGEYISIVTQPGTTMAIDFISISYLP